MNIMRRHKMKREKLIDKLDLIYEKMCKDGLESEAEDILVNNNASEDDSDPDEGFMATMSDYDLQNAITEMEQAYSKVDLDSVQSTIYALISGTLDVSDDYADGFLDACKMIMEEYNIHLDGFDD